MTKWGVATLTSLCAVFIGACGGRTEQLCRDCDRKPGSVESDGGSANVVGTTGGQPGAEPAVGGSGTETSAGGAASGGSGGIPEGFSELDAVLVEQLVAGGHGVFLPEEESSILWEESCLALRIECDELILEVEIVVDRGAGMARPSPQDPTRTNFELVQEMLVELLLRMNGGEIGLDFSPPLSPSSFCAPTEGEVERANVYGEQGQTDLLVDTIRGATPADGGALAVQDAYRAAVERLDGSLSGVVLVVLDGETELTEGCEPTADVPSLEGLGELMAGAGERGIKTLVVGGPGSARTASGFDARPLLSGAAIAAAGFTCNPTTGFEFAHFDMTGEHPVAPLLHQALRSASSCIWPAAEIPLSVAGSRDDYDPPTSSYVLTIGGHPFSLSGGVGNECGVGFEQDEEVARICPETLQAVSCLPAVFGGWFAQCTPVVGE